MNHYLILVIKIETTGPQKIESYLLSHVSAKSFFGSTTLSSGVFFVVWKFDDQKSQTHLPFFETNISTILHYLGDLIGWPESLPPHIVPGRTRSLLVIYFLQVHRDQVPWFQMSYEAMRFGVEVPAHSTSSA